MRINIDNTRINDPLLTQEIADFTHDCYGPVRDKLFISLAVKPRPLGRGCKV